MKIPKENLVAFATEYYISKHPPKVETFGGIVFLSLFCILGSAFAHFYGMLAIFLLSDLLMILLAIFSKKIGRLDLLCKLALSFEFGIIIPVFMTRFVIWLIPNPWIFVVIYVALTILSIGYSLLFCYQKCQKKKHVYSKIEAPVGIVGGLSGGSYLIVRWLNKNLSPNDFLIFGTILIYAFMVYMLFMLTVSLVQLIIVKKYHLENYTIKKSLHKE